MISASKWAFYRRAVLCFHFLNLLSSASDRATGLSSQPVRSDPLLRAWITFKNSFQTFTFLCIAVIPGFSKSH